MDVYDVIEIDEMVVSSFSLMDNLDISRWRFHLH